MPVGEAARHLPVHSQQQTHLGSQIQYLQQWENAEMSPTCTSIEKSFQALTENERSSTFKDTIQGTMQNF